MNGIEIEQFWVDEYWAWMERPVRHIDDIPPWLTVSNKPLSMFMLQDLTDVRTIVAKHLSDNDSRTKANWLQRLFTSPEPDALVSGRQAVWENLEEVEIREEIPVEDTLTSRIVHAQLDAIAKERKQAAQDGVFVAAHHLQKHLASLSNDTSSDTIVRAATQDCIEVLRELHRKMGEESSGGA